MGQIAYITILFAHEQNKGASPRGAKLFLFARGGVSLSDLLRVLSSSSSSERLVPRPVSAVGAEGSVRVVLNMSLSKRHPSGFRVRTSAMAVRGYGE